MHEVDGTGYLCKKTLIIDEYTVSFWGFRNHNQVIRDIQLTAEECWTMIRSKICEGNPMNCTSNTCVGSKMATEEYSYWRPIKKESFKCSVTPKALLATSEFATIFLTERKECKVHDLFCKFEDSIIVWDISN